MDTTFLVGSLVDVMAIVHVRVYITSQNHSLSPELLALPTHCYAQLTMKVLINLFVVVICTITVCCAEHPRNTRWHASHAAKPRQKLETSNRYIIEVDHVSIISFLRVSSSARTSLSPQTLTLSTAFTHRTAWKEFIE